MSDNHKYPSRKWHLALFSVLCFCLLYHTSCTPEFPKEIKDFYYPVNDLDEGLVYHYKSTTNDLPALAHYWFFKGHNLKQGKQLTGQYYDHNKQVLQYFRQDITSSGALMNEYRIYTKDSIAQVIPVELVYNNVFPFIIKDTISVYLYKLNYTNPADSSINTIVRNRNYGGTTEWVHNGKTYPAIRIDILEQIQNDNNGVFTIDLKGYEIYAKGIGLVYTERITRDGSTHIIDRLIDRYSMSDFELALD